MDPFQLEDDGLDPKNILGLPEGLHMKGRIKNIETFWQDFSRFKSSLLDYYIFLEGEFLQFDLLIF